MTWVQKQARPASTAPTNWTVVDAVDAAGPQVCDGMTVEVALSVMASARAGHLLACDEDSQCTGLVTRAQLSAFRDSSAYTDRVRLRDLAGDSGPVHLAALTTMAEAEHARRYRQFEALPVVDEHGCALGVLALSR